MREAASQTPVWKQRRTVWPVITLVLLLLAGCNSPEGVEETATAQPINTAVATAVSTATQTPTPRPTATSPATLTPTTTATPEQQMLIPAGWAQFGDERFGLLAAAPQSWIDWSWALRDAGVIERFGPHLLMIADSQMTAEQIMAGTGPTQGAYAFGFLRPPGEETITAEAALNTLLADLDPENEILTEPTAITVGNLKGLSVDVSRDPLSLFPALVEPQTIRLVTLLDGESGALVTFMMATSTESWTVYQETFATMVETITYVPLRATVVGHIDSGTTINGSLKNSIKDIWTFNGNSGRYATIALTPEEENVDLTLTLIGPSGNVLVSIDNGYAADPETLTDVLLPEDGTYIIEAGEFFNEAGRYTVSLLLSDEPQFGGGGRIEFGQEISSELLENSEHNWTFSGTAGQLVSIVLTPLDDQLDAILEVDSPDDEIVVNLDEGFAGDPEVVNGFELEVTGDYTIKVYGFAGHGGNYTLSLDQGGESTTNYYDAGDLTYGETEQEFLQADEAHAWFINGRLGDDITIVVSPLDNNLDLDVWLLDPETEPLEMVDDYLSGQPETINSVLPTNGQYIVLVREFFGEPGDYEISLQLNDESETEVGGVITYGQTVTGTVQPGKRVEWSFNGQNGDVINVTLRPTNLSRDLVFSLVDPSGNVVQNVDSGLAGLPERLIAYSLTADGEWKIVIQEFFGESSEYELTLLREETS
ncbi:MAG: PPC domain-containing protein [Candidatus Promineifilaceae bacterium]